MMYFAKKTKIWESLSKLSATAILRGQLIPGNTHAEITAV